MLACLWVAVRGGLLLGMFLTQESCSDYSHISLKAEIVYRSTIQAQKFGDPTINGGHIEIKILIFYNVIRVNYKNIY